MSVARSLETDYRIRLDILDVTTSREQTVLVVARSMDEPWSEIEAMQWIDEMLVFRQNVEWERNEEFATLMESFVRCTRNILGTSRVGGGSIHLPDRNENAYWLCLTLGGEVLMIPLLRAITTTYELEGRILSILDEHHMLDKSS